MVILIANAQPLQDVQSARFSAWMGIVDVFLTRMTLQDMSPEFPLPPPTASASDAASERRW
jgi:hypothetical protein